MPAIFYQNFIFHQMIVFQKLWKTLFYFIKKALFVLKIIKFLYIHLPLFFSLSAIALEVDSRKILKYCLNKNLITHYAWYSNNSNSQDWRYIPSDLNVADDCTRDIKFNDLSNNHWWITVPSFLYQQTIELEQDLVTGFGNNRTLDSPINVNLHHPLEDINLSERQLSYTQIVTLIKIKRNWLASKRST